MVSEKALKYLREKFGEEDYALLLQDVTDEELRNALIGQSTNNFHIIAHILWTKSVDPEKKAHLKGYVCRAEFEEVKREFEKCQRTIWLGGE